ncbi:MAG: hypothetical protein Q8S13_01020 [Dehalococcoidia bacterium]|nr:hypothetical protein [Dehalococcoidia bacterium]
MSTPTTGDIAERLEAVIVACGAAARALAAAEHASDVEEKAQHFTAAAGALNTVGLTSISDQLLAHAARARAVRRCAYCDGGTWGP